ncbi:MAG: F0F1 ATP synthase subunit epsilon [Oscillospiraceae bacterium]|nr:F0F1 ATP synthase subunit epsilon [Oscillospiraceae bacterium]
MAKEFRLSVVTGDGTVFDDSVDYLNIPTPFGSVGVLAGHASMLCAVEPGVLRCTRNGETLRIRVGKGVANVEGRETTVLVAEGETLE